MGRIKILYTIPNFDTAGSGKVVYDLVKGLDKDEFEVEIACSSNKGSFFKEVESLGVPIHIQKTTTNYRPYLSLPTRLRPIIRFMKSNKYDVIHSWHWSSDWTEALAARLAGVKWLYTKKAMSWGNRHWKIRSFMANFIITINDEMSRYFPNKKNQALIPLGIDTDYYSPEHFSKSAIESTNFNIITVANLVHVKGIEVLIKAIKEINDKRVELTVLGDNANEYGKYLSSLSTELDIYDRVHFLGRQSDVRPYIANADLYVIPTLDEGRKEGMPMALVEAMSMGVPVLGSNISGINFVLKNFKHLLFNANDHLVLANAIESIQNLRPEERRKLGMELRTYVLNNFSYNDFIKAHQELYIEIIKRN